MDTDVREIAAAFDARARSYARNGWHRRVAERLVALCRLRPGSRVLDAGTGTGFAALAAATAVGRDGHVLGVDVSPGMSREARAAARASGLETIEFSADALSLAWESNLQSAGHAEVLRLGAEEQATLKHAYRDALARAGPATALPSIPAASAEPISSMRSGAADPMTKARRRNPCN